MIKGVTGVESVTEMDAAPLTGWNRGNVVWLDGGNSQSGVNASFNRVGIDYFKTLQIDLLSGRFFNGGDAKNAPKVAIVNETFARMLNAPNPVGRNVFV